MEKIIDCRGLACPLPVVNAKKAAEELGTGDALTVLVDNEIAVQNLTRFAEHKGFSVSAQKNSEKEYAVVMQIAGAAPAASVVEEVVCAVRADEGAAHYVLQFTCLKESCHHYSGNCRCLRITV